MEPDLGLVYYWAGRLTARAAFWAGGRLWFAGRVAAGFGRRRVRRLLSRGRSRSGAALRRA